mgnify:CR=1 FL=1
MKTGRVLVITCLFWASTAGAFTAEELGRVERLPSVYPDHWVIAHDGAFFHMLEARMNVLDADAETGPQQFKGTVNNSLNGLFAQSAVRSEMYIGETFYSRGQRGERTDVVTIYDKATLSPVGEVVLPGGKRYQGLPEKYGMQLIDEDRLLLVFNLAPATSVTVIDVAAARLKTSNNLSSSMTCIPYTAVMPCYRLPSCTTTSPPGSPFALPYTACTY